MKRKTYLITGMLLVLLSLISGRLSSQELETKVMESADSAYHPPARPVAVPIEQPADSLRQPPVETRSCVSTYSGQTVSTYEVVTGCSTLTVWNVTVTSGGELSLFAPDEITINGDFDVLLGGQLNMDLMPPAANNTFEYTYDASGNRTDRTLVP